MYGRLKNKSFYYKDVLNLLSDRFLRKSNEKLIESFEKIKSNIVRQNMVYVNSSYITELINDKKTNKLFNCTELDILDVLNDCICVFELNIKENSFLEQSSKIKATLQIIKNFNTKHKFKISFSSLKDFFLDIVKNQSISFYGDPTNNIHIMGLLESRGLDFDNVIICSANEGVLPSNNFHSSLIPFDLRKKHNLTTIIEDDARTSYDFYHLLLRATNIHLIYNSVSEGVDSGEKSRFIHQLEIEGIHSITVKNISPKVYPQDKEIELLKSPGSILRLTELAKTGFSPSSLESYLKSPIDFYFQKLLNVYEDQEQDAISPRLVGLISVSYTHLTLPTKA